MNRRNPRQTVQAYFAAINGRDAAGIGRVFAPQSELTTPAGKFAGTSAIVEFYAAHVFPAPDLLARPGPLLISGEHVAVEIVLRMQGNLTRVADFFRIQGGLIQRLAVYLAGPA